jgi:glycine/D-amino acid oxidase-like deaminating enzyme
LEYLSKSSEADVIKLVDYKWRGLQRLRQNLGDENIDYRQHGGYELFRENERSTAEKSIESIDKVNSLLKPLFNNTDIYSVCNAKIAEFGFDKVTAMVYNPFEGQIHTGKMMRTLLYKVYDLGVLVLNSCSVNKINAETDHITLETDQGNFSAKKVILATNAFANQLYPDLDVKPGRGQVLVTKPIANLKLKGTYHFNDGYYYFRNIDDRILFGGGRNLDFKSEETWDFGHTEAVKESLENYLREMILPGQHFEIDYWWSGIMGFGDEITPIVKEVQPNIFCAVRCNGMGIAMGSLVGEQVAELALGE